MNKSPFFSIVIPTFNRSEDLRFALFCLLKQTFTDFEIVISDNCSLDNTQDIVKSFYDKRIRYIRSKQTIDMILNQKNAVSNARGDYIFIHSDDDFLPFSDTLEKIYQEIQRTKPGYIRVNYVSLSMDKKRIFRYKVNKPFKKNYSIEPNSPNKKIIAFIIDSDPYFITGIVFKNSLPNTIHMLNTDPVPWIDILFYVSQKFGALFFIQPQIIASWSRRKKNKDTQHHLFRLEKGKLKSEGYLNALKNKLLVDDYQNILHQELIIIYIGLLPAIKANIGNKKMLQICQRIRLLDPTMQKSFTYWKNLLPALVLPRDFLFFLKDLYLFIYTIFSPVSDKKVIARLKKREKEYMSKYNSKQRKFSF